MYTAAVGAACMPVFIRSLCVCTDACETDAHEAVHPSMYTRAFGLVTAAGLAMVVGAMLVVSGPSPTAGMMHYLTCTQAKRVTQTQTPT